jgi:imidazolonepropionase-like amidohydrolase
MIVDELAQRKDVHFNVGCTPLYTFFQDNLKFKNVAAILANAGLSVSIQADTVGDWQHNLLYLASMSVRYGMKEDDALKALTIRGAEAIGLDNRIGSIEEGKDADLVFLNGEPFEMTTSVEKVLIDGKVEYQKPNADAGVFRTSIKDTEKQLVLPENFGNPQRFAIRGGTVFSMAGSPLKDGIVLIKDGKIEKIGSNISIPQSYKIIDAENFVIMPGLVNPRSYMSIALNWRRVMSTDEISKPVVPEMEVKHAIDPQSPDFTYARQLGVTTAMVTPGNRNVIGGQGVIIKTAGSVVDRMILKDQPIMVFGMSGLAKRTNSMPTTRMGIAYLLREALTKAREYMDRKRQNKDQKNQLHPPGNYSHEALIPVLERKKAVLIHCHRSDDIRAAIRLADEFNLKMILAGGTEAYKVVDEIRRREIPIILERTQRRRTYFDDGDFEPSNAALLAKAGIRIAFKPKEGGRWVAPEVAWGGGDMLELAALAVKHGLAEETALRAITIDAAKIIEMDHRVGSLEPEKDANILILKGHPLRVRSLPVAVFIDGRLAYLKEEGEHTQ